MCGITGFLQAPEALTQDVRSATITQMMDAIAHRGPDSNGHWSDAKSGLSFGHLRLAIVDLTSAGHQPMTSHIGRYTVTFNGEIYNHKTMRQDLVDAGHGVDWRGGSDTETLLAAIDVWGLETALTRSVGMFALALWDHERQTLTLARDRMGEKPLYYGWQGNGGQKAFLFGSELHALKQHPAFENQINRNALPNYLRHGNVGEDQSIFAGIHKVRPGETVTLSAKNPDPVAAPYWSAADITTHAKHTSLTPETATDALEALLLDAVGQQMMSDVPLGAFLSGGIDSATIVSLMQHLSDRPVHTFSIGFHEKRYNEAEFAAQIAGHLGTHHTELYVGTKELLDVVPRLSSIYDEPFADSSQIPTFLVAELARQHVTVALSGDGGDELFCGYDRYLQGARLWDKTSKLPAALRALGAAPLRAMPATLLNKLMEPIRATPQGKEPNGQRLHRLATYGSSASVEALHREMVAVWQFPELAVLNGRSGDGLLTGNAPAAGDLNTSERMMQLDLMTYLPDDILTKVDRATMAVALESRAPLLDHRVVEFAFKMPFAFKVREGQSKWLLRQVLYRHVPRELMERPKMGFEVPIGLWLRGDLRDWAEDLLSTDRLNREGYFDAKLIRQKWDQHQSESHNWGRQLWAVLMFQEWLSAQS